MKRCPKCQTEYPDDANWCSRDGGKLAAVAPPARSPHSAPQPGALTMGWDVQPDVTAAATNPSMLAPNPVVPASTAAQTASTARMTPKPGALTMGWDAQPEPEPAPPQQPTSGARMPQQPGALTMGWDVQPEPAPEPATPRAPQKPGALTMGWEIPEEPSASSSVSPAALAAQSVATSHSPAPGKSPAATLIGMQAPWAQSRPAAPAAAPMQHAPPPGATAAYGAQDPAAYTAPVTPQSGGSPTVQVEAQYAEEHAAQAQPQPHSQAAPQAQPYPQYAQPQPVASDPNTTLRTHNNTEDDLDKPPRNMLPIYAIVGVVVIAAIIIAIVLATS